MKLILSLTLLWVLCSTAAALRCQTCLNAQCSSTVSLPCALEKMCATAAIRVSSSGVTSNQTLKGCASSVLCPIIGSETFSLNIGVANAVASVQCCNTDNCNSNTLPFPAAPNNNSLQCFTCNSTSPQCKEKLQCRGAEDRCFQANVTIGSSTTPFFGCSSANLCGAAASLAGFPFTGGAVNITSGPSCCSTNLCNAAGESFRLGVTHLLLTLLIFTLW